MASSDAATPEEYIAELDGERKEDIVALDAMIRERAPELDPHMRSGMLGYGSYPYRYASGKEGEWFVIGLANQKRYLSLGKSCVRFKRLSDLDPDIVGEMIAEAAKLGGLSAVEA